MARSLWLSLALLGSVSAASIAVFGGDAKPPAEPPKPPTTPEPAFENPAFDAKIGETLFYSVRDLEGKRPMRYFEERVLALTKDKILIETVETDATNTKFYSVEKSTGWKPRTEKLQGNEHQKWIQEKAKAEILYLGEPPTKAIRTMHRFLDEPADFTLLEGPRRVRQIWYSHDIPASGRAKMFPALRDGERMVISWDRMLPADECEARRPLPRPARRGAQAARGPGRSRHGRARDGRPGDGRAGDGRRGPSEGSGRNGRGADEARTGDGRVGSVASYANARDASGRPSSARVRENPPVSAVASSTSTTSPTANA